MRLRHHRPPVDESETGIDLAPMLDFVLNLLIFFIITAVFVKELGITISRPSSKQPQQQDQKKVKSLLISIKANGEIYIDQRVIDLRAVRSNIACWNSTPLTFCASAICLRKVSLRASPWSAASFSKRVRQTV